MLSAADPRTVARPFAVGGVVVVVGADDLSASAAALGLSTAQAQLLASRHFPAATGSMAGDLALARELVRADPGSEAGTA